MACKMPLRLVTARAIRCFLRHDIHFIGQRDFGLCLRTGKHNLISPTPTVNKIVFSANYQQFRSKWKRKDQQKKEDESDSDSDEGDINGPNSEESENSLEPGTKIVVYRLESPRVDKLIRKALNMSGKCVEDLFYNKKIYLHDHVLFKKSHIVITGDIITVPLEDAASGVVRGALIEVLDVQDRGNGTFIKIARNKNTRVTV